ncbi:MAG: ABC transporter ATP-binding protein [Gammaproteobacteria bacterium]|nr:ABC transporter ATP-binding protein [Gammaproteobacteria bacterium]
MNNHAVPAIEIRDVVKSYRDIAALKSVSLSIPQGSFFALLGPNGAGKSTLISVIAGLVKADAGHVRILGHDVVSDYADARRLIGLVPQELIDEPFFAIQDLLRIQAGYFGFGQEQWPWIDELLHNLGLWDKRKETMPSLSGGMKRRVLIALALVHKPKVLVLDEPTAGVDIELRLGLWTFIRQLHAQGMTIILTTHYLEEAEQLCEQIAILREGQLLALSSTQALLAAHPWEYIEVTLQGENAALPETLLTHIHRQQANKWVLRLPRGQVRTELVAQLQQAGCLLSEIRSIEASLEDVFRAMTSKDLL